MSTQRRSRIIFDEQPMEPVRSKGFDFQQEAPVWDEPEDKTVSALQDRSFAQLRGKIVFDEENQQNFQLQAIDDDVIDITPTFMVFAKGRHWSLAAKSLVLLGATILGIEMVQFLYQEWVADPMMAGLYTVALGLVTGLGASTVWKEFRHLRQLKQLQRWHKTSLNIEEGKPENGAKAMCEAMSKSLPKDQDTDMAVSCWQESLKDNYTNKEILDLYSTTVLKPIDDKATKVVTRYASETALMVAVSPLAMMDMAVVLWRSVRMINEISELYGVQLGYLSRIRLLRTVVANVLYAGAAELVADAAAAALSLEVAGKLSTSAAQGMGAGLLTGRLGFKTMQCCRAIPSNPNKQKRLGDLSKLLLKEVTLSITRRK